MMLLRLLSRLPLWFLYGISDVVFVIGYYLIRYRRKVAITNLQRSFPEVPPEEIARIEKAFYRHLCDYTLETLALLTMPKDELARRVVFTNVDVIAIHAAKKQSIMLFASHLFNWEWLLSAGSFSIPFEVDFVYQKQSSRLFNQFLLECRTRFGGHAVVREQVAREVLRRKDLTVATAIVADQFPGLGSDKRYWTMFLNQDTAFFQAINQVTVMTQYPAYFAAIRRKSRGYYTVEFIPISEPPYARDSFHVVDQYARVTEAEIARQPENWLWSHKRWKRPRESGE